MAYLVDAILTLESYGLSDVWLPFFIIFISVYAILNRMNLFTFKDKDGNKKPYKAFNMIVSLVLSILPVMFHATGKLPLGIDIVEIINNSITSIAIVIIAIVCISLIIGPFGSRLGFKKDKIGGWILGGAILFIINFAVPTVPAWVGILTIFIVAVLAMGKKNPDDKSDLGISLLVFGLLSLVVYIFGSNMGYFSNVPYWIQNSAVQVVIVFIAIILFIISMVTKE